MGRRAKSKKQKQREGNPGKRSLKKGEPELEELGDLAPAAWLPAPAKREWLRVVKHLVRAGVLKEVDKAGLEAYCLTYHHWVQAERKVAKEGILKRTPNGFTQENPAVSLAKKYLAELGRWAGEFGMTPASRTKVQVWGDGKGKGKGERPEDPGENWFSQNRQRSKPGMGAASMQ